MTQPHWTDDAASPVFDTVIDARGPGGNVFAVIGRAMRFLQQLEVPADRIERLKADVMASGGYDEAIAHVERWFRVERG